MRTPWRKWVWLLAALCLPFLPVFCYRAFTVLPAKVTLATGSPGGRYHKLGQALARRFEQRTGVPVELRTTEGSLEGLDLLARGAAQFSIYQQGTLAALANGRLLPLEVEEPDGVRSRLDRGELHSSIRFLANLYADTVLLATRPEAGIGGPRDLAEATSYGRHDWPVSPILLGSPNRRMGIV